MFMRKHVTKKKQQNRTLQLSVSREQLMYIALKLLRRHECTKNPQTFNLQMNSNNVGK